MAGCITRCPACQTAFRVSDAQLAAAGGRVRCGACARVFDALAQVAVELQPTPDPSANTSISQHYIDELLHEQGAPQPPAVEAPGTPEPVAESPVEEPLADPASAEPLADPAPSEPLADPALGEPPAADPLLADAAATTPTVVSARLPIEMERVAPRARIARLGWMLASAIALLGLLAQYAWYERATLALDPRLRPWYARACAPLGCELPAYRDFASIRSEALKIRPAPGRPGMLLVDALLVNRARFAQDFPGVQIEFADMQGRVLASRVFLPHEYLDARTPDAHGMAPREPVSVHLEIVDPGEDATNYRLYLRELPPEG